MHNDQRMLRYAHSTEAGWGLCILAREYIKCGQAMQIPLESTYNDQEMWKIPSSSADFLCELINGWLL